MQRKLSRFSKRYATALRKNLQRGPRASPSSALRLGRYAVILRLETLDLARIHEAGVARLDLSRNREALLKRATSFFSQALTPIMETHEAARQSKKVLNQLNDTLGRRTLELRAANRQLSRCVLRRKRVETTLENSGKHYAGLLKESLQVQEGLRQLTHQILMAQEDERRNISRELQDEIVQTLLGINVRLLTLKQEARSHTKSLRKEIASTQRQVLSSAKSVRRVARQFSKS